MNESPFISITGNRDSADLAKVLEIALSHISDFAYVFDCEGRFLYANKALLDLWGLTLDQAEGKNFFDLQYPPDLAEKLQRQILHVVETKEPVVDETPYTSPSGHEGYYEYIFNPCLGRDGRVVAVVGSTHVITGRKRSEDAARQLAAIVESSQDAIISKNLDGIVISWNHGAELLFGYTEDEMIGKPVVLLIPPEWHDEEPGILNKIRQGKRIDHYETIRVRKDGSRVHVSLTVSPIKDSRGEVVGASKIARDITERKQAEQELNRIRLQADASARAVADAAERFRLLAEVISLQVWTATPAGELDWANQETTKFFGTPDEKEILGNAWTQFVHPDDLPAAIERWYSSLASGARYEVEFRLRRSDGKYRWFLVRAEAMRDAGGVGGPIVRWFGTNTDIHALKNAQYEAERASHAKDSFLATLSHELRTPLTPVLMTAAALREDERIPADVREQLGMMERNIALEVRLIDDMLDLTRISRGQIHMRPAPCDAHSLIGLAIEIVRDDAREKGIKLDCQFGAARPWLVIDPARFQQVIWNLLRNAVKFTPAGGLITIVTSNEPCAASANSRLRIEVTDSGIGIDPSTLEKIFLPFEQGSLGGDHRYGGIGLGLAIARAIVDLHGGAITAHSAGVNCGSTFVVDLPGATEHPTGTPHSSSGFSAAGTASQAKSAASAASLRLLLVEDHESTLLVLTRLLKRAGYRVTPTSSIAHAIAVAESAAATDPFGLVISDLGLPDGTGTELMEKLRAAHGLGGIALSGYGMEADIERSREAGFIAHITKPVDFHQLQTLLEELCESGKLPKSSRPTP